MYSAPRAHHHMMGTRRLIGLPTSGCGWENPAQWTAIEAILMDRLRFAHPTG